ncbi:MAG: hypothetical protein GY749_18175, partial [Desulfobacteraceae bacterium]|nr:hypothetical protein [Desulfobacteraceae bacterium]
MKTDLIKTLNNIGLDLTGQEIADILWLAPHLDKPALQENKEPEQKQTEPDASIPKSDFEQPEFQDKDTEPSPEQPRAEVFQPEPETKELTGPGIGGIPFRSPAAPALPGELSI